MKALVLAGGLGTRLGDRLEGLPKPMVPVGGRPFLAYVLDQLVDGGAEEILLSVGYRADAIQAHFGDRYGGVRLRYVVESEPLGTGGAIQYALRNASAAPVLVLNGDTFLKTDYRELLDWHAERPSSIAMILRAVDDVARFGAVTLAGDRVSSFVEKGRSGPGLINSGTYVVNPETLAGSALPRKFSFEAWLQDNCSKLEIRARVTRAYFIDIGVPEELDRAQRELPEAVR